MAVHHDADGKSTGAHAGRGMIVKAGAAVALTVLLVLIVVGTLGLGVQRVAETRCTTGPAPPSAVVALLIRSPSTGRFVQRGSGFCVEPGVVVTARDDREGQTDVYFRVANSERLLRATPVPPAFPSALDVFRIDGADVGTLRLSESPVRIGDGVEVHSLPFLGSPTQVANVSGIRADGAFAVALFGPPLPAQVGGPVLGADGTVVGVLTPRRFQGGEYLVVPVARIVARLAGQLESGAYEPVSPPAVATKDGGLPAEVGRRTETDSSSSREVATRARVLKSPPPGYTEEARKNGTGGTVILRALLGADRTVKSATVVRGLPDGLNEKALEAVHKLEFTPALDASGVAIDSELTISINFAIRGESVRGTWYSIEPSGGEQVQFFIGSGDGGMHCGYAILERAPDDFACVPLNCVFDEGAFELTATRDSDGCRYRWTGRTGTTYFVVDEVHTCRANPEPVHRTFRVQT